MSKLVVALEDFRALIGKPVIVDDAYRCAVHNAQVGGAPHSEHVQGIAADIRVEGMSAAEMEEAARKIPEFKGIGRDDVRDYIHVDVRDYPAEWCYDGEGRSCAYYPPSAPPETIG